jgi:serine/threonine protein kinase
VFVRIARDAAAGLLHLHREKVIHRDVAARNILVGINYTAYVSDLGLARLAAGSKGYTMSTTGPLRHMAPEAILNRQYSAKSDAYSFGVFLWELTHRGEPYANWTPYRIQQHVVAGGRPPIDEALLPSQPSPCPPTLVSLMQACWAPSPDDRPDLSHVYGALNAYYGELKKQAVEAAAASGSASPSHSHSHSQPRSGLLMSTDALFAEGCSGGELEGEYYYVDEGDVTPHPSPQK